MPCGSRSENDFRLTTPAGLLLWWSTIQAGVWRSLDKGNAVRLLFPQLYRVRTLTRPLWEAPWEGESVGHPGSQETCSKEGVHNLRNGRLPKESHLLLWGPDVTAGSAGGVGIFYVIALG